MGQTRVDPPPRACSTEQAFDRAAGAPLVAGNAVRLLKDAAENYPAWLEAIRGARERIHLEVYILADDAIGRQFAEALVAKAREGVRVRLVYDWLGALTKAGRRYWRRLREGGVEVRRSTRRASSRRSTSCAATTASRSWSTTRSPS